MKFGNSFTYNGISTKDKNLILTSTDSGVQYEMGLDREIVTGNATYVRHEVYGIAGKYSDVLTLTFTFLKDPCIYDTQEQRKFSREDIREITAWLTSPNIPLLLEFEDYDDTWEPIDFYGNFTSVELYSVGEVYGLTVTFQCNAPWGYSKEKTYFASLTSSDDSTIFEIDNDSDDWESYVYPCFKITPNALEETITIQNITDDLGTFSFTGYTNLVVNIDSQRLMVWDDAGVTNYSKLGWTTDTMDTIYWPRLIHGENKIKIMGNCDVTMKFRLPRKVGEV